MRRRRPTWAQQLRDPRWKACAKRIKERDGNKCTRCGKTSGLQVHHKEYWSGLMAWEYPPHLLETLCGDHHQLVHRAWPD